MDGYRVKQNNECSAAITSCVGCVFHIKEQCEHPDHEDLEFVTHCIDCEYGSNWIWVKSIKNILKKL